MGETTKFDKNEALKQLSESERLIHAAEELLNSAKGKKAAHEESLKLKQAELQKLGVPIDKVDETISQLSKELEEALEAIRSNIPMNLLKEMGVVDEYGELKQKSRA